MIKLIVSICSSSKNCTLGNIFIICVTFLLLTSCLNDETLHPLKDDYIKLDGYLPLAPGNTWVYETWSAKLSSDGTYSYEDFPVQSQSSISKIEVNSSKEQITYKFSPFSSSLLGGLLGNFNEVIKVGERYYKNVDIDISENTTDINFKLNGSCFLNDSIHVGDLLHTSTNTITSNIGSLVEIKYTHKIYVTGKYDKIPNYLSREKGVDDHLNEFEDIVKVTDSITIEQMYFHVNDIKLDLNIGLEMEGGNGKANFSTYGKLGGWALVQSIVPPLLIPTPNSLDVILGNLSIDSKSNIEVICPAAGNIVIQDKISHKFNLISNDTPIYIDSFYAKGVGKIKSITNIDQVKGKIEVNGFNNSPYKINVKINDSDPDCKNYVNSITVDLDVDALINEVNISIPISGGLITDFVQNLKYYSLRKSLN